MLKINALAVCILVIPHDKQRYDTCGDWWLDGATGILEIRVSKLDNYKMEMSVALHEYIEALLCFTRGIREQDVTAFDIEYEKNRLITDKESEPGDSIKAPYYREHQFATAIEAFFIKELGVDWTFYEKTIQSLDYRMPTPVVNKPTS